MMLYFALVVAGFILGYVVCGWRATSVRRHQDKLHTQARIGHQIADALRERCRNMPVFVGQADHREGGFRISVVAGRQRGDCLVIDVKMFNGEQIIFVPRGGESTHRSLDDAGVRKIVEESTSFLRKLVY